ncbi:hypothetical protein [Staphylococcus epidermidis]|uniref:hypothetical protein n=1 Tax=Staphylococcus epidermidis TaxID=1282 RepID=UPI001F2342A8|nr:hypothetical protein [Staphylococcus epidermidis]MCE4983969.1 hypothetical protein [Staphylococcus epidermidis]
MNDNIDISKLKIPKDSVNKLKEFHSDLDECLTMNEFEQLLEFYQNVLKRLEDDTNQKLDKMINVKQIP